MLLTALSWSSHARKILFGAVLSGPLMIFIGSSVIAEEIRIPVGQQAGNEHSIQMPTKGMTKESVKTTFGEPLEAAEPKGNPPISRWRYSDFVVYFEYDHVIHTVRLFKPTAAPSPLE